MQADALPRATALPRWRWLIAATQPVLGGCWLILGFYDGGGSRIAVGIVMLALGSVNIFLLRTRLDTRGIRPAGRFRRVPWPRVCSVVTSNDAARRDSVGLVVQEHAQPVWLNDPDKLTLQWWAEVLADRSRTTPG